MKEVEEVEKMVKKFFIKDIKSKGLTLGEIKILLDKKYYFFKFISSHKLRNTLYKLFGKPKHTKINGKLGRYYFISKQKI